MKRRSRASRRWMPAAQRLIRETSPDIAFRALSALIERGRRAAIGRFHIAGARLAGR